MDALLYFIITVGILVFIHEFGHFAAARLCGIQTDAFAIGFGYRLFGWNKVTGFTFGELPKDTDLQGHTDYKINLLPLGGYVKIAGMVDESMDTDFASKPPQPHEFRSKSTLAKVFVITGGVLMNLLLALAVFWGNNYFEGKTFSKTTTVGYVAEQSLADSLGFQAGDKILAINGKEMKYWEDIRNEVFVAGMGLDLKFAVERNAEKTVITVPRNQVPKDESQGPFLLTENLKPVVSDLLKDAEADKGGIKTGDILLSINDTSIYTVQQTIGMISNAADRDITLKVLRGEKDTLGFTINPGSDGKIGVILGGYIYLGETENITYGFFESVGLGFRDMGNMSALTFIMLKRVITGDVEFKRAFGGPIKIAQFAARSADSGLQSFLMFLGLLSLSLALLNILPFPALDGGHLVMILIEGAMKREIPLKTKIVIQNAGFVLLLVLMAFILYNDILSL